MSKSRKMVIPKMRPRNFFALIAKSRHAGPMKHRNAPKGGARNNEIDILAEYEEEYWEAFNA